MYMYVSLLLVVIKRGLGKCIMHYMQHYYSLHFTYYLFFSLTKSLQLNLENSIYNLKISYLRADS